MSLEIVGEHTVDTSLLRGGWVLDAGCRDFTFARGMHQRGNLVLALDADPTIDDPKLGGIEFHHWALDVKAGAAFLAMDKDPQARCLTHVQPSAGEAVLVPTIVMWGIPGHLERDWDVVKLDIEGAEYAILEQWPGPIAKQITVEFHEHVRPRPPELYARIFKHLGQWYDVVQHEKTARHCTHPNYWDTLLVRR